jgi:hypothetical protein
MAHFAKIENGIVTQVIVIGNEDTASADGIEKEYIGAAFCERLFGGEWKQTSYNGRIRKNYASVGYAYDVSRDAFIPPQPYPSWTMSEETCLWSAPTPMPTDGFYSWDESTTSWVKAST